MSATYGNSKHWQAVQLQEMGNWHWSQSNIYQFNHLQIHLLPVWLLKRFSLFLKSDLTLTCSIQSSLLPLFPVANNRAWSNQLIQKRLNDLSRIHKKKMILMYWLATYDNEFTYKWYIIYYHFLFAKSILLLLLNCSVMSDSLWPHRLWPSRVLCPWNFPGKNTGVGCHFLLQSKAYSKI